MKRFFVSALLLFSGAAFGTEYQIDSAHTAAQFSVKHLMVSTVRGQFSKVTGTINYDPKNVDATAANVTIDPTTIDTREQRRDTHLKSPDFFDVAKFPTMTYKSTKVWKEGNKLMMAGDLNMHGVTKPLTLTMDMPAPEIKDAQGNLHTGTTATAKINRKDWGLTWNRAIEAGGVTVSDEVDITLDIEAVYRNPNAPPPPGAAPAGAASK